MLQISDQQNNLDLNNLGWIFCELFTDQRFPFLQLVGIHTLLHYGSRMSGLPCASGLWITYEVLFHSLPLQLRNFHSFKPSLPRTYAFSDLSMYT
jgi:hypothetical protein